MFIALAKRAFALFFFIPGHTEITGTFTTFTGYDHPSVHNGIFSPFRQAFFAPFAKKDKFLVVVCHRTTE
jgi:hypothetical protein